jgi:phage shock protein C
MASHCVSCGTSLPVEARFCSNCGKAVAQERVFQERLIRPIAGRKIAGVCQGIALHSGWDVTLIRVTFVLLTIAVIPLGLLAYALLWVFIPQEMPLLPATTRVDTA